MRATTRFLARAFLAAALALAALPAHALLLLTSTSDKVQVVTGQAADIEVHSSYVDNNAGTITPGRTNTASITTATTTDVVAAPGAGVQRNVKFISITNNHATAQSFVEVLHTDGTNAVELRGLTLLPGENLTLDANGNWRHYDSNGAEYQPGNIRKYTQTTSDQSIGASVTVYLTGSAIDAQNLKVGTIIRWSVTLSKTAAATVAWTLHVGFGPNGSTSDTSRASQATGTQTAAADVGVYEVEIVVRTLGASGNFHGTIALYHALNATGMDNARANIITQAQSANFDMTVASLKAGLWLVTGTSHAVTIHKVVTERIDPA